jgi:hypothetical protein
VRAEIFGSTANNPHDTQPDGVQSLAESDPRRSPAAGGGQNA